MYILCTVHWEISRHKIYEEYRMGPNSNMVYNYKVLYNHIYLVCIYVVTVF